MSARACSSFPRPACEHFKAQPQQLHRCVRISRRREDLLPWRRGDAQTSEAGVISSTNTHTSEPTRTKNRQSINIYTHTHTHTHTHTNTHMTHRQQGIAALSHLPLLISHPWSDDDDDEDDEPTLLCVSSTVCVTHGAPRILCTEATLIPRRCRRVLAVQYSRSQV